jgi:hypothetical protein
MAAEGSFREILAARNLVDDGYLSRYWLNRSGHTYSYHSDGMSSDSSVSNVALLKPATQSSVYLSSGVEPPSARSEGHGNDGTRSGTYGFHTSWDERPWWCVDLLDYFVIREIRLYNRVDDLGCAERARNIAIEISADGTNWHEMYSHQGRPAFGGHNGTPLTIRPASPPPARFVRIVSRVPGHLHLDEVEVYGSAIVTRPPH